MNKQYATDSASLRNTLCEYGIKEPMWSGFQWTCKFGTHIRRDETGTFELRIDAEGRGYSWSFERI
jgi:hypothetical protein